MFPYKIRKPAWGSSKPQASSDDDEVATRLGGDPDDPHTIGGNLQRALLLDMLELRRRYCDAEESATPVASPGCGQHHSNKAHHTAVGSSFARFKACFREARFGAIHTRTIPPRVDRGEYVQLLYSSCFYLLEQSFGKSGDGAEPLYCEDNSHPHSCFNAIYAAFLLYTLHQTNVLPEAPLPRSHTKRTKSGELDEQSLKEAWAMLSIGLNNAEEKNHRRTFRSGVRIDRWNYLLLLRLRDMCLARAATCDLATAENGIDSCGNATRQSNASSRRCNCGLARDATKIIDKMLFSDSFFEYSEYHGPQSLEGLAGSPNFYRAHFVNPLSKEKQSKKSTDSSALSPLLAIKVAEVSAIENEDRVHQSLDLQNLSAMIEKHCSNLTSMQGQLQKSQQLSGDLQPKQRELVINTLLGIESSSDYMQMVYKLSATGKDEVPAPSRQPDTASLPAAEKDVGATPQLLAFSETFSSALCDSIQGSLLGLEEDVDLIRRDLVKKIKGRRKRDLVSQHLHEEITSLGDLESVISQQDVERENLQPAASRDSGKRGKRQKRGSFLELESEGTYHDNSLERSLEQDDNVSLATGAGKNALLSLLAMAGDAGKAEFEEDSLSSDYEDLSHHVTGTGKRALQSLLAQSAGDPEENTLRKRARKLPAHAAAKQRSTEKMGSRWEPANWKKPPPIPPATVERQKEDMSVTSSAAAGPLSDEEFSVATDTGKNALAALLSNAENAQHGDATI